jgi:hypothetical protein
VKTAIGSLTLALALVASAASAAAEGPRDNLKLPFSPVSPGSEGRRFALVAKGVGLAPESKLTREVLSDPAIIGPLARALGIGTDLSENEWVQAHAIAFYASKARSKARQAENAAAASHSVPNLGQAAPQPQQAQPPPSGTAPR